MLLYEHKVEFEERVMLLRAQDYYDKGIKISAVLAYAFIGCCEMVREDGDLRARVRVSGVGFDYEISFDNPVEAADFASKAHRAMGSVR